MAANYAVQGILKKAAGIILGKPQDEKYFDEYKEEIQIVMREFDLEDVPILYNLNFGHTEPKFILPYGVRAEIVIRKLLRFWKVELYKKGKRTAAAVAPYSHAVKAGYLHILSGQPQLTHNKRGYCRTDTRQA